MAFTPHPHNTSIHQKRLRIARVITLCAIGACVIRVAQWTLLEGDNLAKRAISNFQRKRVLSPPRGNLYDRNGAPLAVETRAYSIWMARYRNAPEEIRQALQTIGALLERDMGAQAEEIIQARPRWKQIRLAKKLNLTQTTPLLERSPTLPGLRITEERYRRHPSGPSGAVVVGYTTSLWPRELKNAKALGLHRSARIGRLGLERFYNQDLRGTHGWEVTQQDARGRQRLIYQQKPARPGFDLITTLDGRLQRAAYESLRGYQGTVIMMNPQNGEILCIASRPSFDPEAPGKKRIGEQETSFLNRALMRHYPPGSPFKIVTALAALQKGYSTYRKIECKGRYISSAWPNHPFHCNNRAGHGYVDMTEAIQYSCNVYFYRLSTELGAASILKAARSLGLGSPTGVDLPGEVSGTIGALLESDLNPIETLLMGIGQGPVAAPPLQMLRAISAVGGRGNLVTPHLGRARVSPEGVEIPLSAWPIKRLEASRALWEKLNDSMGRVVNEPGGTAFQAQFPSAWRVCGKTGTAERGRGKAPDAWFIGYAPAEDPEISILVMLERAGHGGTVAAPLARDLLAAYFSQKQESPTLSIQPVGKD